MPPKQAKEQAESKDNKDTKGITAPKEPARFADWYTEVVTKTELIDYYDVSGCYILRPWAMSLWKCVQKWFGDEIAKLGVQDAYFPCFVSQDALEREKDHVEGFAPEVAWVTRSGSSDLPKPIALRPTSETVMYPAFARWIRSHRDLPMKLNQWCNVVRWEFSHPQPFIRTREFLWQEGHTAFANEEEAVKEVFDILDLYGRVYTDLFAVPVMKGRKTEKEKFAGAAFTTTVETYIPTSGRGCQGATSHHLGQNFSKMFDIKFENPAAADGTHTFAFQNSWGLSTRSLGVLIMVHGDNKGLVMPPRVAPIQVVIIPCGITAKTTPEGRSAIFGACTELATRLNNAGFRAKFDDRDAYSPGWKFSDWEMKGVSMRIEVGPKDLEKQTAVGIRRDVGKEGGAIEITFADAEKIVGETLERMQAEMLARSTKDRNDNMKIVEQWADFTPTLNKRQIILSPCCGKQSCEDEVKKRSKEESQEQVEEGAPSMGAKSLCIPLEQPERKPGTKCIISGEEAIQYTLFGRSY